jgi:hypothetical protein
MATSSGATDLLAAVSLLQYSMQLVWLAIVVVDLVMVIGKQDP